jgi:phage terminase large subunit-like protein
VSRSRKVDFGAKKDCAAVVAVMNIDGRIRLAAHRIWRPKKGEPLDPDETIVPYLLELREGFPVRRIYFDPWQLLGTAAALRRKGLYMTELPQTPGNLTEASQALYDVVRHKRFVAYPDEELRRHVLNAVAVEGPRGWRLAKEKSSRQIDGAVALSFAVLDAVKAGPQPSRDKEPDDDLLAAWYSLGGTGKLDDSLSYSMRFAPTAS